MCKTVDCITLIVEYYVTVEVTHVILDTRPSHFLACNIEIMGKGLGTRLHMESFMSVAFIEVLNMVKISHQSIQRTKSETLH